MGGQRSGGGGEEVEQIDALGQMLLHPGKGGHVDEQQGAAPHAEAGEHTGRGTGQDRDEPAHRPKSDFAPP